MTGTNQALPSHLPPTPMSPVEIRPAESADADAIARIYNHYVLTTAISFEEKPVPVDAIRGRMAGVGAASLPWLVATFQGAVRGYAYAARWHQRHAYRFTVECTVYVDPDAVGARIGSALYDALFPALSARQLHAAVAVIALPNAASVALHERFGMKKVAHFEQVGFKFGRWHDVGSWQKRL
ncbi:MAG: N-acetyltransferase family protein [Lautropia sp.]